MQFFKLLQLRPSQERRHCAPLILLLGSRWKGLVATLGLLLLYVLPYWLGLLDDRLRLSFLLDLLLWLSILALILLFAPIDATAAWLLVPYLAWVSFAAFLNLTMLRLNPAARPA